MISRYFNVNWNAKTLVVIVDTRKIAGAHARKMVHLRFQPIP